MSSKGSRKDAREGQEVKETGDFQEIDRVRLSADETEQQQLPRDTGEGECHVWTNDRSGCGDVLSLDVVTVSTVARKQGSSKSQQEFIFCHTRRRFPV